MDLRVGECPSYIHTATRALDPRQRTAVFLHGAGMDHTVWLLQSRYFAHHGWNVLVPDLPGHGRSGGDVLPSVPALADWVVALLQAVGLPRAALIGHSMGGLIALELAIGQPARVDRLGLLGVSVPMAVSDSLLAAAAADDHRALEMINTWGHGPRAQLGGNPVPGMWMSGLGIRLLERAAPGVVHTDLAACSLYRPDDARLAAIACPTLVLAGRHDRMTPFKAVSGLAERIPGARLETVDSGHMLMSEVPDAVLGGLGKFLGQA